MNKFLMILAAAGLSAALSAPVAMAAPGPDSHETSCTGTHCNKALNATHHGKKGHKSRKVRHDSHHAASHHTAAQHQGHKTKKDCHTGHDCQRH